MNRIDRKKLIKRLVSLIIFLFLANFLADKFYWYSSDSLWYFDMIMHFFGGFWVGLVLFCVFEIEEISLKFVFKILLFTLTIGIGWEIFEILVNDVLIKNPFNYLDTFSDIFFDLSGGTFAILYFFKRIMFVSENKV